jgi:hypothetical protein
MEASFQTQPGFRPTIKWGGVWAGFFVALGVQVVLASIGLGTGLHAVERSGAETLPVGIMIWTAVAWLFSAFLGGYVAVWMSGVYTYWEGMFHGFVTWGVLMSALAYVPTIGNFAILGQPAQTMSPIETTSWWLFAGGTFSLAAALFGGIVGARAAARAQFKAEYRAAS